MVTANWKSESESTGGGNGSGIIKPGKHHVVIEEVVEEPWKDGMVSWKVTYRCDHGECKGDTLSDWFYLSPKAIWRLAVMAKKAGCELKDGDDLRPPDVTGKDLVINVEEEEFNGKMKTRVKSYHADGEDLPF